MTPSLAPPGPRETRRLLALLAHPPEEAARLLLGTVLVRRLGRHVLAARIVETEAYLGEGDPAAHSFRGRTPRTAPLWEKPGTVYVYFIYGMYYCLNLSVEREGVAGCVLVRAAEPVAGDLPQDAARGPGRLCRALAIDVAFSGHHVFEPRTQLWLREGTPPARVGVSGRVGIRHAQEEPLRFFDEDSPAVSQRSRAPFRTR